MVGECCCWDFRSDSGRVVPLGQINPGNFRFDSVGLVGLCVLGSFVLFSVFLLELLTSSRVEVQFQNGIECR